MGLSIVVLVPDAGVASGVRQVAASRYWGEGASVHVLSYENVASTLNEARRMFSRTALAVVASDAPTALMAIEAGADEAMVLQTVDQAYVLDLLSRARVRALHRIEMEQRHESSTQIEKLTALGTLVAGVAHEVNNPLTAVLLSLEILQNQVTPLFRGAQALEGVVKRGTGASHEELAELLLRYRSGARGGGATLEVLSEMANACESIADIVRDLGVYARSAENETPELVRLPELIDKVVRLLGRDLSRRAVFERDYDPSVPRVFVPRTRLTQVLTNLLVNASQAVAEVEREVHRIRISLRADEDTIMISVSDTGPGIAANVIERIFDPFFTTKRNASGTGLGLSISRSIMQDIGGDLLVESVHGDGATFVAWLPMPLHVTTELPRVVPAASRSLRVMIVESDPRVLGALARFLRSKHEVLLAADGQEAIELFASGSVPDVVVSDADAEDQSGRSLVSWLEAHRPELCARTLLTVGHQDLVRQDAAYPSLSKPLKPVVLLEAIERLGHAERGRLHFLHGE